MNHYKNAKNLTQILDSEFNFLGLRFGFDPIIGLIPGLGDLISLTLSLYILWIAFEAKISGWDKFRMLINILFDFLIGLIPFLGDLADFFFKANLRNLKMLEKYQN